MSISHSKYVITQKRPQEKYCYQSFVGQTLDVELFENCKSHLKQFFIIKNIAFDSLSFDIHEFRRSCQETQYTSPQNYQPFKAAINRYSLFSSKTTQKNDESIQRLYRLGGKLDSNEALWELNQFLQDRLEELSSHNLNQTSNYRRSR